MDLMNEMSSLNGLDGVVVAVLIVACGSVGVIGCGCSHGMGRVVAGIRIGTARDHNGRHG